MKAEGAWIIIRTHEDKRARDVISALLPSRAHPIFIADTWTRTQTTPKLRMLIRSQARVNVRMHMHGRGGICVTLRTAIHRQRSSNTYIVQNSELVCMYIYIHAPIYVLRAGIPPKSCIGL